MIISYVVIFKWGNWPLWMKCRGTKWTKNIYAILYRQLIVYIHYSNGNNVLSTFWNQRPPPPPAYFMILWTGGCHTRCCATSRSALCRRRVLDTALWSLCCRGILGKHKVQDGLEKWSREFRVNQSVQMWSEDEEVDGFNLPSFPRFALW